MNKAPKRGISPRIGTDVLAFVFAFLINPPNIVRSPSFKVKVVLAFVVEIVRTAVPFCVSVRPETLLTSSPSLVTIVRSNWIVGSTSSLTPTSTY